MRRPHKGSSKREAAATPHLTPRRQPVQERAQKTVDVILDAAALLLEDAGLEGFNTNVLAERAGVQVRTVYRYFPNKLAVITALAERLARDWDRWFDGFQAFSDPLTDGSALWSRYIDTFVTGVRRTPGALAIRRAMRAQPELRAVDRRDNERLARQLAAALAQRNGRLERRRLTTVARLLVETAVTVLDLALLDRQTPAHVLIDELKNMQLAYLAPLLADGPRGSSR